MNNVWTMHNVRENLKRVNNTWMEKSNFTAKKRKKEKERVENIDAVDMDVQTQIQMHNMAKI